MTQSSIDNKFNINAAPIIEIKNLTKHFINKPSLINRFIYKQKPQVVKAVDDISFTIAQGKTLGLIGESGCGKTTLGRTLLKLIEPTSGQALYNKQNLYDCSLQELNTLRTDLQIIFQDPYSSLNPRLKVRTIIGEAMTIHGLVKDKKELEEKIDYYLKKVGLDPSHKNRYPHEFSGGQRQRLGIARALALEPKFIVCDEAVSALDVSIQAQILNLLMDLQDELGLTYLFISHDLSVVKHIRDTIAVMYLGKIVEIAPKKELFQNPQHPYTKALLKSIPTLKPRKTLKIQKVLEGDVPSPLNPPKGCYFHPRCPEAEGKCKKGTMPELVKIGTSKDSSSQHQAACLLL